MGILESVFYDEYATINEQFKSLEDFTGALEKKGLGSANLIIGVDYSKNNEIKGKKSFGGQNLHKIEEGKTNPYQEVIKIIGQTLEKFDADNIIPIFGFCDEKSKDEKVFPLLPEGQTEDNPQYCKGFEEVLKVYEKHTPSITQGSIENSSFAPMINKAAEICMSEETSQYHILLLISTGNIKKEKETIEAIKKACDVPLSIVVIGVGDGKFDQLEFLDDKIDSKFDILQFVNYPEIVKKTSNRKKNYQKDLTFAVFSLMEIPDQFAYFQNRGLIGKKVKDGKFVE